jgi:hypothetical protein
VSNSYFMVYLTTLSVAPASNDEIIKEPERIWNEAGVTYFEVLSRHLHDSRGKLPKFQSGNSISGPGIEPSTSRICQKCYCLSQLARWFLVKLKVVQLINKFIIIIIIIINIMALQPFVVPSPLLSFFILYTVGRTPWTGDQPVARPLPTQNKTQTQNKRTQTSMPHVGFEPTIPAFKREKTVHALHRAANVIAMINKLYIYYMFGSSAANRFCRHNDAWWRKPVISDIPSRALKGLKYSHTHTHTHTHIYIYIYIYIYG